jgi:glycosyltransferase involved in cell wall biosynthesis
MTHMKKLLLVLPTYNEELVIAGNIQQTIDFLQRGMADYDWKILIADNGSTDKTINAVKKITSQNQRVDVFHLTEKGRGRALKKAWTEYQADIYGYMDADLATDLKYVKQLVGLISSGAADVAIGSRTLKESQTERSLGREITSRVFNFLLKNVLDLRLHDAQCGFKFINQRVAKEIIPTVQDNVWFFDTELLYRAQQAGYIVEEVPVTWIEKRDKRRKSTVNVFSTTIDYLRQIWRLRRLRR